MSHLIEPHGGTLCKLLVNKDIKKKIQKESLSLKSLTLNDRQICDIEMLLNGGFSPLRGFLGQSDYDSVVDNNRLSDGVVWPIPITLDVSEEFGKELNTGDIIVLRDHEGVALAVLNISDKWTPDLSKEAEMIKCAQNTMLASRIALANMIYDACEKNSLDYRKIKEIAFIVIVKILLRVFLKKR